MKDISYYQAKHLSFGWKALLVFLLLGATLETLHGFKIGWYLDVANETRRLLWTLSHAHGALIALVNILYAVSLPLMASLADKIPLVSNLLIAANILMPGGFFLAGIVVYRGDPGISIIVALVGAACLILSVLIISLKVHR